MGWVKGALRGKDVWVEVNADGSPTSVGGRVPVRYSDAAGAKLYGASLANLTVFSGRAVELPAGSREEEGPSQPKTRGSGFGSAGTRTVAQAQAAKAAAGELVKTFDAAAVVCFTDGSCKGNPGPAGSGVVVKLPDGRRIERSKALGQGTNNIAELTAIGMAMEILDEEGIQPGVPIEVLSDSQYSIGVLAQGWKAKANVELVDAVKKKLKVFKARLHWVAGHSGVPENERADSLANAGVEQSRRGIR